ncbi:MAG TPA: hypothetical protein VFS16_02235 [Acidimicrobiia bacterium]|nr:hypothetical protein [Acidimicrobiia bacterium]
MRMVAYIGDPNLFGWYLGWAIGSVIITVIVAEVAAILRVAKIIGGQAEQADQGLHVAYDNTYALRDLTRTRDIAASVTRDLHRTRRALEG